MPRISPLSEPEWTDDLRPLLEAVPPSLDSRLGDSNVFSTLARHKDLFFAWLPFFGFFFNGVLSARERELLILRTARNCDSSYEWGQHVPICDALGMAREEIMRVLEGPEAAGWTSADAALLRAADELHERAKISAETWAKLTETHDERALIEIAMLVGHYHLVAYTLSSLEVELDEGLEPLP